MTAPPEALITPPNLGPIERLADRMQAWAREQADEQGFPHREIDALREAGLFAITLPGEALDQRAGITPGLLHLLRIIGRGNLAVGRIYEGHVNALYLIHLYGTDEQRHRYYAEARAGHLFGVWNTEMADGIHLHRSTEKITVNGSKSFCSGSTYVTRPLITGVLHTDGEEEEGWQMCIVPLNEHDVPVDESFWRPAGMRRSVSYKLDFSGIPLREDELLGRPGEYTRQPHFSGGAVRFAAVQLGGAEALLDATRDFLRQLGRTGDGYQRTRVGRMAIQVQTGKLWLDSIQTISPASRVRAKEIINHANMLRTVVLNICEECLQLSAHSVGARGMLEPHPFGRLHADLTMYLRQPAPDATLEAVGQHYLDDPTTE